MRISSGLAILLLCVAPAFSDPPAGGKTSFAKVYLKGNRVFDGEVLAEDDKSITLKTDLATVPLRKEEILQAHRSDLTAEEAAARRRAKHTYTSLLLGYRVTKPESWQFKFDPPAPLSDVMIRNYREDLQIDLFGTPDPSPETPLDDRTLESFSRTIEGKLKEKFLDVRRASAAKTVFKEQPGFFIEFTLRKKESKKEYRVGTTAFRHARKLLFFGIWAPIEKYAGAKAVYDATLDTVAFTDPNPLDGDRLFNTEFLFAVVKPADWTFAKTPQQGAAAAEVLVSAPGARGSWRLDVRRMDARMSLETWGKDWEKAIPAGVRVASSGPANVSGRFGRQWVLESGDAPGARRRTTVTLFKEEERGYIVSAEVAVDQAESLSPMITEMMDRFRVLNDLLSEGALDRGLRAIDAFDEGDKLLYAHNHRGAIGHYEQAVAFFPRFAAAFNNMGIAQMRLDDLAGARRSLQKAFELFGEEPLVRGNFGLVHVGEAHEALRGGRVDEAARLAEKARSLAGEEDSVREALPALYANIGIGYANKTDADRAVSWLEKALQLKPKDADITRNLSLVCANTAVTHYNKRDEGRALAWAKKALKYDPQCAQAKQILDALQKLRSK